MRDQWSAGDYCGRGESAKCKQALEVRDPVYLLHLSQSRPCPKEARRISCKPTICWCKYDATMQGESEFGGKKVTEVLFHVADLNGPWIAGLLEAETRTGDDVDGFRLSAYCYAFRCMLGFSPLAHLHVRRGALRTPTVRRG